MNESPLRVWLEKDGALLRLRLVDLPADGEIRRFLLASRRIGICVILLLGFLYYRLSSSAEDLASIGLIAFAGVVQVLPCLVGGLFWRRANAAGALAGLVAGALLWAYTLFLPSFAGGFVVSPRVIAEGPFGLARSHWDWYPARQ